MYYNRNLYRRKLFSSDTEDTLSTIKVVCQDCGYVTEIAGSPTGALCPKCGGTRFSPKLSVFSPDDVPESIPEEEKSYSNFGIKGRISLFSENDYSDESRFFSIPDNSIEQSFNQCAGDILNEKECRAFTGLEPNQLVEKGFADFCNSDDSSVKIHEDAYLKSKLFSKIIITITKTLDLDPKITSDLEGMKSSIIDSLEKSGEICPKGIILIKKAHGIIPTHSQVDSVSDFPDSCSQDWLNDSGILGDLKLEFGGLTQPSEEFSSMLSQRYPDAPSNILDLLRRGGIIKIGNGNISILK